MRATRSHGLAIRTGIKGNNKVLLDLRLQYVYRMPASQSLGFLLGLPKFTLSRAL
jgi:hypothetical protein